jgi:hypothetical protein
MRGAEKCGFGALIVESPSLWIGDPEPETFLKVSACGIALFGLLLVPGDLRFGTWKEGRLDTIGCASGS